MGWFDNILGNVRNFYNSTKETVQSIYTPVKSIVNTIASGASSVNDFINKAKDIPLLRDVVSDVVSPIWDVGYSALRDINDGVNYAGNVGSAIDQVVGGALGSGGGGGSFLG